MAFLNQRMLAAPDETRHIWKLDGPLEDVPNDEFPSMAWLHMAHTGPLPPIWDLLDLQPNSQTLHLLSLVEFTDLLNGCAPDALVRNAFVILRMVATARSLPAPQEPGVARGAHGGSWDSRRGPRTRGCGCAKRVQLTRPTLEES
jgi:hypothetical protein